MTTIDAVNSGPPVVTMHDVFFGLVDGFTIQHGNNGQYGGGFSCNIGFSGIFHNIIEDCSASIGGGIDCDGCGADIKWNTIQSNTASEEGGGIMLSNAPATVAGNILDSNEGTDHGGGIAMHAATNTTIVNNLFIHNHTDGNVTEGKGGGAIHAYQSGLSVVNNTFVENYVGTGTWPNIQTSAWGGAVHLRAGSVGNLINNIFYGNLATSGDSVACTVGGTVGNVSYSDAWPGTQSDNYYEGVGAYCYLLSVIRYLDPDFYDAGNGCYWLDLNSALRQSANRGQNYADNILVPVIDIGEHARPGTDGCTDMGAYQSDPGNYP